MSYRSRQRKRMVKQHRRNEKTKERYFLIDASRNGTCQKCRRKVRAGTEAVYRNSPKAFMHRACAEKFGIEYRLSARKEMQRRARPRRMRDPARYSPQELLAELVLEAGKTRKGGYTRAMLARWGVAWPPPHGWPRDLIARWSQTGDAVTIKAELDRDLDRALERAA